MSDLIGFKQTPPPFMVPDMMWLAGAFDAGLSMRLVLRRQRTYPALATRDEYFAKKLAEMFGGNPKSFYVSGPKAQHILRQVRPYMRSKVMLADEMLAWKPKRKGRRMPKKRPHTLAEMLIELAQ